MSLDKLQHGVTTVTVRIQTVPSLQKFPHAETLQSNRLPRHPWQSNGHPGLLPSFPCQSKGHRFPGLGRFHVLWGNLARLTRLKLAHSRPVLCNRRSLRSEKPERGNWRAAQTQHNQRKPVSCQKQAIFFKKTTPCPHTHP